MSEVTTVVDGSEGTKKERPAHLNKSIHPRVVNGKSSFPKVNTSKKKNPSTIEKKIAAIMHHMDRHPHDDSSRSHLLKLKAKL